MRALGRLRQDVELLREGHHVPGDPLLRSGRGGLRGKLLLAFVRPERTARSARELRPSHRLRAGPEGAAPLRARLARRHPRMAITKPTTGAEPPGRAGESAHEPPAGGSGG